MGVNEAIGSLKRDGLQAYHLDVVGSKFAPGFDVVDFAGVEEAGAPTTFRMKLTHRVADLPVDDILTKTAVFSIRPPTFAGVVLPAGPGRQFQGVITQFNQLSSSKDETTYEAVLESRIALLKNVKRCRIFLGQTDPEIIEQIFREHEFGAGTSDFEFTLRRDYPKRDFVMQWNETDLDFFTRLARRSGIWFVIRQGEYGEVTHFGDDFTHYERSDTFVAPFRPTSGLESTGAESVEKFETRTKTIAQAVTVRHYNHRKAPQPIDGEANAAPDDKTTWGTPDVWAAGHLSDDQAEWEAQLRHEALLCEKIVYTGEGNVLCVAPGRVFRFTNRALPEAEYGQLVTRVEHAGSRDKTYHNTYTAIPSHLIYRMPLLEEAWPKIHGTISGRITSPDRYKYSYVNKEGHYMVLFDFDREERTGGLTSCWMRIAKPFAGPRTTGHHFPALDGSGVEVAFENGNPDFPYIAHVMHDSVNPDVITSDDRWMTRNVIRTQSNNTLQMEDFEGEEHIKLATEGGGKSQLNLGNIVNAGRDKRGSGAELRSDDHVAVRGGKGVFVSADNQPMASGKQLEMRAAEALLQQAIEQMQAVSDTAKSANAYAAEVEKQRDLLNETLKGLRQAGILLSAPAGMGLVSGDHLQVSASKNLIATAGGNADIGILRKLTVAVGDAISLFAQKLGIKIFASQGKVEIQAQGDEMSLGSLKDLTVTSTNGRVVISASKEVWIGSGGSYIKITGSGIENVSPGDILERCAFWDTVEPASETLPLPQFPRTTCKSCLIDAMRQGSPGVHTS
ncbi:type VI secretion system Vgr family protein [Paraburkholderia antibiotica]|uniref:type VI secretion system Vgr family protein n=1 Tax=Paraburkholderia antibiotica TaxID=2728839 RepID=UPI00197F60AD|nr:type VI secretion system Vgr family protein [Paraburkholderia antibiotica]